VRRQEDKMRRLEGQEVWTQHMKVETGSVMGMGQCLVLDAPKIHIYLYIYGYIYIYIHIYLFIYI